jgi:hypothetical protein
MTQKEENIITNMVKNILFTNNEIFSKSKIDSITLHIIIKNGTNLLARKWGLITHCDKFLQSIINNKLNESFLYSDEINQNFMKFYVILNRIVKPEIFENNGNASKNTSKNASKNKSLQTVAGN